MSERPTPDLTIVETRVYRGANVWSYEKAIHLVVDLGRLHHDPHLATGLHREDLLDAVAAARDLLSRHHVRVVDERVRSQLRHQTRFADAALAANEPRASATVLGLREGVEQGR